MVNKLLGKAMDKEFWKQVREKDCYKEYREHMQGVWDAECEGKEILAHRYRDFKIYFVNGNRSPYSKSYYLLRRQLMASAMLSLIYPDEPKYLDYLMDVVYTVCDEYTWCLNAHQPNLETNNNCHIDLFAAETALSLAETYHLLGDRLDPLIKNRIVAEIDRRIVNVITKKTFGWERATHNWNAVCTGSIGCTFMLMHPEMMGEMLPRFESNLQNFLSGFHDDGMCLEGCHYWHYGFGHFVIYADMVRSFTNGEVDHFKNEKVKTIAQFIQKAFISGDAIISFSDGSRSHKFHMGLVHYLRNEYPDVVKSYDKSFSYVASGCARFAAAVRGASWLSEEYYYNPTPDGAAAEYYAEESQMLIKRTRSYGFAAKAAHNAEPHNHNDVGSFIFAKNGRQVLVDLGSGPYSQQYFHKDTRYGHIECSSRGHSVPIVGGVLQSPGAEFGSKDVSFKDGIFSMDIAGAYACEGLNSIRRSFSFTEDSVTMTDTFDYSGSGAIVDRIATLIAPVIDENAGKVIVSDTEIAYDPAKCGVIVLNEQTTSGAPLYFIDFTLKNGSKEFVCEIR